MRERTKGRKKQSDEGGDVQLMIAIKVYVGDCPKELKSVRAYVWWKATRCEADRPRSYRAGVASSLLSRQGLNGIG